MEWIVSGGSIAILLGPAIVSAVCAGMAWSWRKYRGADPISLQINELKNSLRRDRKWIRFYNVPQKDRRTQILCAGESMADAFPFAQMRVEKATPQRFVISWYGESVRRRLCLQFGKGKYPAFDWKQPGSYEGWHVCGDRIWKIGVSFRNPLIWAESDRDQLRIISRYEEDQCEYYELHSQNRGMLLAMRAGFGMSFFEATEQFIGDGKVLLAELDLQKITAEQEQNVYWELMVIMMFLFLMMRYAVTYTELPFQRWLRAREDFERVWRKTF